MEFRIYQLKNMRETEYGFMGWDFAEDHGFKFEDYKRVYSGLRRYNGLDDLFEEFNIYSPVDFRGHSLSVSDIVAVKREGGEWKWYYCDSFGWEDITVTVCKQQSEEEPTLCGFVYCHGNKDFSAWEVELPEDVRWKIQAILDDYVSEGTSERNVWDQKFSDVFGEEY